MSTKPDHRLGGSHDPCPRTAAGSGVPGSDKPSDPKSLVAATAVTLGCVPSASPANPDHQTTGPDVGPPPVRVISKNALLKRVPLSFPTIWKMMQQNRFPRARVIAGKSVWIESEINDFLATLPLRRYKGDNR
jgi:predicted DNA-binding transcriptional regulator AlpA